MVSLLMFAWVLWPFVLTKGTSTELTSHRQKATQAMILSDVGNIRSAVNRFYEINGYYHKNLNEALNCADSEVPVDGTDSFDKRQICTKVHPETNQPYPYTPLDCNNQNQCRGFRIVIEVSDEAYRDQVMESQKKMLLWFGHGVCSMSLRQRSLDKLYNISYN